MRVAEGGSVHEREPLLEAIEAAAQRVASAGRAAAVVVHHVADLMAVAPGDIIVCSSTTPAWCVAIAIAPASAAALRTGDVITVDGTAATVTLHPPG